MDHPILLYDGLCPLCNGVVKLVLRTDKKGLIHFAALQSSFAEKALQKYPEYVGVDTVVLLDGEHTDIRSGALRRLIHYLRGPWSLLLPFYLLPRPLRDWLYDRVAMNRKRLGAYATCPIMPVEFRKRFHK